MRCWGIGYGSSVRVHAAGWHSRDAGEMVSGRGIRVMWHRCGGRRGVQLAGPDARFHVCGSMGVDACVLIHAWRLPGPETWQWWMWTYGLWGTVVSARSRLRNGHRQAEGMTVPEGTAHREKGGQRGVGKGHISVQSR
eukprot:356990-Chlamydomonas_euryale.AAC.6